MKKTIEPGGLLASDKIFPALLAVYAVFLCLTLETMTRARIVEEIGDCFQVAVPVYAFCLVLEKEGRKGAGRFALGFLVMMAAASFMKLTIDDKRPNYTEGDAMDSFPSRHTAAAFFGAVAIHRRYGLKRAVIPYAMAAFTGYSRVETNHHYTHDVVITALALFLIFRLFLRPLDDSQG